MLSYSRDAVTSACSRPPSVHVTLAAAAAAPIRACGVCGAGPTERLIPRGCQKIVGLHRHDFVCHPRSRQSSVREIRACQSAFGARSNYDQIILVEAGEKRWRVTQGWHPEEGVRGAAENHKRFGIVQRRVHAATSLISGVPFSDINELNLPKTCGTEFPDPDDLLSFKLIICPDEVSTRVLSGAFRRFLTILDRILTLAFSKL